MEFKNILRKFNNKKIIKSKFLKTKIECALVFESLILNVLCLLTEKRFNERMNYCNLRESLEMS